MKSCAMLTAALVVMLQTIPAPTFAQYGHPLKGQWSGEWGPKDNPRRLLLDLQWDGKAITGTINPGQEAAAVKKVTIDYSNIRAWKVQIEAEGKDASGKTVAIRVNGTLENLGVTYRVLHGTWTEGGQTGDFTVTRN